MAARAFYFSFCREKKKLSKCFIQQKREHCYYKLSFPNKFPELYAAKTLLSRVALLSTPDPETLLGSLATPPPSRRQMVLGVGGAAELSPSQEGSEKIHSLCGIPQKEDPVTMFHTFQDSLQQQIRVY